MPSGVFKGTVQHVRLAHDRAKECDHSPLRFDLSRGSKLRAPSTPSCVVRESRTATAGAADTHMTRGPKASVRSCDASPAWLRTRPSAAGLCRDWCFARVGTATVWSIPPRMMRPTGRPAVSSGNASSRRRLAPGGDDVLPRTTAPALKVDGVAELPAPVVVAQGVCDGVQPFA